MTLPGTAWCNLFHAGSVVAAGREASKEAISAVPVQAGINASLSGCKMAFQRRLRAAVGILSGFL